MALPGGQTILTSRPVERTASQTLSGRTHSMNQPEFDIEVKPARGELRSTINVPPDSANRTTITEETHLYTTLQTTLVQVQYGLYNDQPACLLIVDFRFKFRPGVHRVKSVKIHIELSFPPTAAGGINNETQNSPPYPMVVKIAPRILHGTPVFESVGRTDTASGDAGYDTLGLHFSLQRESRYDRKLKSKIEGVIIGTAEHPESQIEWDVTEANKVKSGVVPFFRAAVIISQGVGESMRSSKWTLRKDGWLMDSGRD